MIRNWQYTDEYEQDRAAILQIVDRVFSSGRLILGTEVLRFEQNFAAYCGARFGIGVNSGTDALFLGLKALGIGGGDEVITVANTAVPTVAAIRAAGAIPVFVDVEPDTFLMDTSNVAAALTSKTKCILPVHLFGQAADMVQLQQIAERAGVSLLEDCAQAAGASLQEKRVGSFGRAAAFSFYPTKVLGGYGDGGMIVTNSADLNLRLRRLRFYGMDEPNYAEVEGYNSRLDELHAAILDHKLRAIDDRVNKRRAIAERYSEGLRGVGDVRIPVTRPDRTHQFYVYTIRTRQRDALYAHLSARGIEVRIHYPTPVHLMPGYSFLGYRPGSLPITEKLAQEILALPLYPMMPVEHADAVVSEIRRYFYAEAGSAE